MRRWTGGWVVVALTTVVVVLAGGLAWADTVAADGDGVTPVSSTALAFGTVCANTTVTKDVLIALESGGGNGNSFKKGTNATISVGTIVGTGLSGAMPSPQPSGSANPIVMPSNWHDAGGPAFSSPATARITFVTGAPRAFSGSVQLVATGTDFNGGPLTRNATMNVSATVSSCDTTPPTLSLPANQTVEATGPGGSAVTFAATATDADPASPAVTCTPPSGSTFAIGTTTVSCSAQDAAGNVANGSFSITVQDTTGPSFGSATNITREATGPTGAVVSFTDPVATDLVDGVRPVVCAPSSGSTFPLGTSTVSCSASDTRGNAGATSFSVTVSDTSDPTLVLPGTVTREATGPTGAAVDYASQVSASDTADPSVVPVCDPASGSTFALGATEVGCSATDDSGNEASGAFDVVVVDTTAPALTLPASFSREATSGAGRVVTYAASALDLVDGSVTPSCSPSSGSTFPLGATTVTCSATDAAGNTASEQFTITVVDSTAPTLSLPIDIIAEADQLGGKVVTFTATADDAVDGSVVVTCTPASGSLFAVDTTTVSCSSVDAHGNESTGELTVTITDTTDPFVTVPADLTLEATGPAGAIADFASEVSAEDIVDGALSASCSPSSGSTFALGDTTVTCEATDAAGNTGSSTFVVSVLDTTPPAISGTPEDLDVEATGPSGAVVTFTNPDAADLVDGTVAVVCDPASGDTFPLDTTTTVTCEATDAAGNAGSSTFTVLVSDRTGPVLSLPGPITEEATGPTGATVTFVASATDAVDPDVPVTCDPPSGTVFALGTTQVDCTATDDHANASGGSFQVTVEDTTAPTLTVPDDITAEATGPSGASVTYAASALDIVDGAVGVTCDRLSGETFALGDTEVSCSATDAAGNEASDTFTITVVDTTAPVLTLPGNLVEEATGPTGATVAFVATATDLVDGSVLVTCLPAPGVFPLGTTTVDCTAGDAAGNVGEGSFDVTVRDTTAPNVTIPDDITAEATSASGASVTFDASSTDAVDGPGTPTCTPSSASVFAIGTTTVTCTITDAAGNTGSAQLDVMVQDTTGPAISGTPSDLTQEATGPRGAVVTFTNPTATDLVDGSVTVTCTPPSGSTFPLDATTAVTCTASDIRGNASSSSFNVTVSDTQGPTLTLPSSFTAEATGPAGAPVPFTTGATDVVDGTVAVSCTPASGDTFGFGPTPVACSAADAHGNVSEGSFTITVVDTTAPTLTVPADLVVEATGPSGASVTYTASALDLVDGSIAPSCSAASGSTFALGVTTVTCTATDAAGNASIDSFTVTVRDTTAPALTLPASFSRMATSASGAAVTFTTAALDVVDGSVAVGCTPASGATFAPGAQLVTCVTTDSHANSASGSFTVSVLFDLSGGFLQPVNPSALNIAKGGSTVPLKFQVRTASGGYLTSLSIISGFVLAQVPCSSLSAAGDEVDFTTTGGTTLRYDTASNQYIQNWQTPKRPGTCYRVEVVFTGGLQRLTALFQLK